MRRRKNQRAPPPRPGGGGAARGGGRPASPRTGLLEVAEDQVVQLLRTDRHRAARARPSPLGGEAGRVPVPLSLSQPPPSPPPGAVGGKGALRVPWSLEPPPARRGGAPPSPPAPPAPAGASRKVKAPLSRSGFDFFFVAFFWFWVFFLSCLGFGVRAQQDLPQDGPALQPGLQAAGLQLQGPVQVLHGGGELAPGPPHAAPLDVGDPSFNHLHV